MSNSCSFVIPQAQQRLLDFLAQLEPTKRYEVTIEEYKKHRSLGLNAYYWANVNAPLADHCGESPDRMHEVLCGDFWGWEEKEFRGITFKRPRRTTTTNGQGERDVLSGEAMRAFVQHCEAVAAEMGVRISYDKGAE